MVVKAKLQEQVINEIKIMYSLHHPYIIRLINHFETKEHFYLVLEFADGGQVYGKMLK